MGTTYVGEKATNRKYILLILDLVTVWKCNYKDKMFNPIFLDLSFKLQWPHYYLLYRQNLDKIFIFHSRVLILHLCKQCFIHISIKPSYNDFKTPIYSPRAEAKRDVAEKGEKGGGGLKTFV